MGMRSINDDHPVTLSGAGAPEPKVVGTCRVEARLPAAQGSRLFRAVDLSLGKTVVVKLMTPPHDEDTHAVDRFLAFGQALVGLSSPHIVPVLRAGRDGPTPYLVLEWIDGEDLETVLRRDRQLVPQAALRAVLDAAAGLDAAQKRGVLHGDVRPRHLLRVKGEVKVTGFGLSPTTTTSQGRQLGGHPGYMAPEVIGGRGADHRADMYSLGCTLFELLVGRAPYGTSSPDALLACHLHEPFPPLKGEGVRVTPELEAFLARLVAKDPDRRFSTWAEVVLAGASLLPQLRHLQPTQPALIVEEGRQQGERIDLPEGELLLGRVAGEGFALDDGRVSRRHAMVRRSGDYLEISDLSSRNGIRVNGVDVRSRQLLPGDRIEIGDSILRVEAPTQALPQIPVQAVPVSPVRGAFGDVEVSHPPPRQATPQSLAEAPFTETRQRVLGRLAPLLAARPGNPESLRLDALGIVAEALGADHRVLIRVKDDQPVFEAATAQQAQLLSGTLPAVERALPGQLSLSTTVRVNVDDRWAVVVAPLLEHGRTVALAVLVKRIGRFDGDALAILEATCGLLGLRADAR
jgi:pSer/pThr/pTyr-binding forkhead associated (FHA) protein